VLVGAGVVRLLVALLASKDADVVRAAASALARFVANLQRPDDVCECCLPKFTAAAAAGRKAAAEAGAVAALVAVMSSVRLSACSALKSLLESARECCTLQRA
jgi:hypothetical protein